MKALGKPKTAPITLAVNWLKERHAMWIRRKVEQRFPPWSNDPLMCKYSWTNTTRRRDRGTLHWYSSVYAPWLKNFAPKYPELLVFNTCLYRIFNRITTWETIAAANKQPIVTDWYKPTRERIIKALEAYRDEEGGKIFTQAYFTWGGGAKRKIGTGNKPRFYIDECIATAWEQRKYIAQAIEAMQTQEAAYVEIKRCLAFGGFIASQIVYDLTYTSLYGNTRPPIYSGRGEEPLDVPFEEMPVTLAPGSGKHIKDFNQWVMCGPGATQFLRLCWPDHAFGKEEAVIAGCIAFWKALKSRSTAQAITELDLHDAENALCECWKLHKLKQEEVRFNPRRYFQR